MSRTSLTTDELRNHVNATYVCLRYGIAALGFMLPIILIVVGLALGVSWQPSISQYYHTTLGNVFVGSLFGIGAFLYLYKGFSPEENIALNVAGIAVICVALFPTPISPENLSGLRRQVCPVVEVEEAGFVTSGEPFSCWQVHLASALIFFFAIAYVCIRRSGDTLHLVKEPKQTRLIKRYAFLGWLMVLVPITAAVVEFFDVGKNYQVIFVVEWAAIFVFAVYWWTKSREFSELLEVPEDVLLRRSE